MPTVSYLSIEIQDVSWMWELVVCAQAGLDIQIIKNKLLLKLRITFEGMSDKMDFFTIPGNVRKLSFKPMIIQVNIHIVTWLTMMAMLDASYAKEI